MYQIYGCDPGFSQQEQELLAILTQGHRGKIDTAALDELPTGERRRLCCLLVIIRLAARFKYVEILEQLPDFGVQAEENALALGFPEEWLEAHPLTLSELEQEQSQLSRLGVKLSFS